MALATGIAEKYVELSHGRTRYLEAGTGEPTILLHGVGFTAGGDSWFLNIAPLAEKVRVLALDFVGWGLGDRLDMEYSFAYLVDFVREFQDALGIEKSNIVGHSMGGWIATLLAYESPDRLNKVVLSSAGGTATRCSVETHCPSVHSASMSPRLTTNEPGGASTATHSPAGVCTSRPPATFSLRRMVRKP